jgi:CRP-like cAMP-binding protein
MPGFLNHGRKSSSRRRSGGSLDFPQGHRLYEQERPSSRVYFLRSGQVQLTSGRGAIVDYLGKRDFFGEKAFLQREANGQVAKSVSAVEVSTFSKSQLLDRVQHDRRFATRLLKNLALRLDRYEQTIEDFVREPAEQRLARVLFRFLPPRAVSGWVPLRFSPTNSELARTIRSTRWRVAHFMRQFQQLGWLERRPELWVRCEGIRGFLETTTKKT